jgi:hypothetical protein
MSNYNTRMNDAISSSLAGDTTSPDVQTLMVKAPGFFDGTGKKSYSSNDLEQMLKDADVEENRLGTGAGAGRGKQGGPTAKELSRPKSNNYAKGGKVSGASKRADGIAQRGKTKGRYV